MFSKHSTEVLVAGAGPVGLFTALSLAQQGIEVEIVDGQWRTASRSYALALHPRSLELLDEIGLFSDVVRIGHRVDQLAFYDGSERRGEVRFAELESDHAFVVVLPQHALESLLEDRLADEGVKIQWNHRLAHLSLNGKQASARIERLAKQSTGYSVGTTGWVVDKVLDTRARFVVGADGHNSVVRRSLGVEFTDLEATLFFGVFEFDADSAAFPEVRVVLDDDSTNVLWPLADGRFRWSFELGDKWEFVPSTRAKDRLAVQVGQESFPYLDMEKMKELAARRAPWFDADLGDVRWSVGVRFERRLAKRFGRGSAWLVGDAAHLASPIGVQSMNVGLREGHELTRCLVQVLRHGGDADLLETYNAERLGEWRRLLGLENGVAVGAGATDWIERRCRRIPQTLPASGRDLQLLLRKLGIEMPH
jgi:2-polyprenyl-6-methoxyphenol hydroxylase-like FAD-dependent oxidoreductase